MATGMRSGQKGKSSPKGILPRCFKVESIPPVFALLSWVVVRELRTFWWEAPLRVEQPHPRNQASRALVSACAVAMTLAAPLLSLGALGCGKPTQRAVIAVPAA